MFDGLDRDEDRQFREEDLANLQRGDLHVGEGFPNSENNLN